MEEEKKKRGRKKILKVEEEEVVPQEEPKKRGRKKKEVVNELIEKIQDMKIEDFVVNEEEEKNVSIDTKMEIEEEDQEREERREIKSKRLERVSGVEMEEKIYYLYLCKRRLEAKDEKGEFFEYQEEKIQHTLFIYQIILYGSYENDMVLYPTERSDLEYEDEIEMIANRQRIKIRVIHEKKLKELQKEIEKDQWKILMIPYRKPKSGKVLESEIFQQIMKRDEWFVGSEKKYLDHTELLNRPFYFRESERLIMSSLTLKDLFLEFAK